MKPKLPPMPEKSERPKLVLEGLRAHLMLDLEQYSSGSLGMTIADCGMEIKKGDKKVGSIYAAIGGGLLVGIGDRVWGLNMFDIWKTVEASEREQYRK